ncbi:MAG: hypothetical protein ACLRZ9_09490 [Eubacterium sp.]
MKIHLLKSLMADLSIMNDEPVAGLLYVSQFGMEGGNAIANLLLPGEEEMPVFNITYNSLGSYSTKKASLIEIKLMSGFNIQTDDNAPTIKVDTLLWNKCN